MTEKALEAMMLVIEWAKRNRVCEELRGEKCSICPYYLAPKICDKQSTTWVLYRAADVFQKYFDEIQEKTGD